MKQKQSNKLASLKSLMVLPLACIIMVSFAQTKTVENATGNAKKEQTTQKPESKKKQQTTAQSAKDSQKKAISSTSQKQSGKTAKTPSPKDMPNTQDEIVVVGYGSSAGSNVAQKSNGNSEVFTIAEEMPKFADGNVQMFLARNIRYPVEAQKNNIQGRVICQFVVEKDGSISSVNVVRSVNPLLDAEACRVLYTMPKWIPGKQKGQIVRVKYTLPINFKLNK